MKISIIMPHKDSNEKYFKDCIASLKQQLFQNFELIIAYNDSNFLDQYVEDTGVRVKLIKTNTYCNISELRNIAISNADGEYILFMDSDDYLHPNSLIYAEQIINKYDTEILRLKVVTTNLDLLTTYENKEQSFYKRETLQKLEQVFTKLNLANPDDSNLNVKFMKEIFEEEIVSIKHNNFLQHEYFKKIKNIFNLNGLIIKKEIVINNHLELDSTNNLYGEIPFILGVLDNSFSYKETNSVLYYKLRHNDPINFPSFSQLNHYNKETEYLRAMLAGLKRVQHNELFKYYIKNKVIKYYLYNFIKTDIFEKGYRANKLGYQIIQQILLFDSEQIKLNPRHKLEINNIKKGNFFAAYSLSKLRLKSYNYSQLIKPKKKRLRRNYIQKQLFTKMPLLENTIVYESFLGRNYSDSPKAIFKFLLDRDGDKWKHVWILNDKSIVDMEEEFKRNNVKIIKRFSWSYYYYVTVSKYFILNMRQPIWLEKKKNQTILSTWHGTPLKRLVFDMDNVASANPNYKRDFYNQSRNWDYLIAANKYSENIFNSAFMYPKEKILTMGYPRNDVLTKHNENDIIKIKNKLSIPLNKKVILYAPTWRDDEFHSVGKYKFNLKLDLNKLKDELGSEYIILLRMHYFISDNLDLNGFEGFAYDFSKYNDINDLYISSDILITDYSSVFFDYANLEKPILFYTYDIEKYRDMLRGFYIDMERDLPGPLLYDTDEVIYSIKNINEVNRTYGSKYKKFIDEYCNLEDGFASERIVNEVIDK